MAARVLRARRPVLPAHDVRPTRGTRVATDAAHRSRRMRFDVCTLFPGLFDGFLSESLVAKAIEKGLIDVRLWGLPRPHAR